MAALKRGQLFLPSFMQCRSKFTTKREKNKVLERRVFELITKPILPEMLKPPLKQCSFPSLQQKKEQAQVVQEENLYEQFLIRRCREMFTDNKMVIVCGRMPITKRDTMIIGKHYKRSQLTMQIFSNEIVKKTIADSKWQNLDPVITLHNCYITSPENRVKDFLKVLKKTPQLFVLAGVVESRLLSKDDLVRIAALPSHDQLLGQTVSLLGSAASKTHSLLNSHQTQLSQNLSQYIKDQQQDEQT